MSCQNATAISPMFTHFDSLEVVWFNGNRLSRIENLEDNFRIREVYLQDNRLVSLSGLRPFKFLRVLMASNNQLRNLDKQLAVLSRFAFLKKLDLFDNPVAEEPDYRLRIIYHVPQIEVLDRRSVKVEERIKADEVVPNLDKVSAAKAEKSSRKGEQHSALERAAFKEAKEIIKRRQKELEEDLDKPIGTRALDQTAANKTSKAGEEGTWDGVAVIGGLDKSSSHLDAQRWVSEQLTKLGLKPVDVFSGRTFSKEQKKFERSFGGFVCARFSTPALRDAAIERLGKKSLVHGSSEKPIWAAAAPPESGDVAQNRALWSHQRHRVQHELVKPSPWELHEMRKIIEKKGGKELTRDDVATLVQGLAEEGVEEVGRVLGDPNCFQIPGQEKTMKIARKSLSRSRSSFPRQTVAPGSAGAAPQATTTAGSTEPHPLDRILQDPSAKMPVSEVTNWLLSLEWPRPNDDHLNNRIGQLYEDARRAEFRNDAEALTSCRSKALRLEGAKTQKHEVLLGVKETGAVPHKGRGDHFFQTMLQPRREVDEATGRIRVKVENMGDIASCRRVTSICG